MFNAHRRQVLLLPILVGTLFWISLAVFAAVMLWRDRERALNAAVQNSAAYA
jgi:hypothetical protein